MGRGKSKAPSVVRARGIRPEVKLRLAVAAGARCQFPTCNKFLFEHPITLRDGNFSQMAHIVAFSEEGPRGRSGRRPRDINGTENLMLLCATCHKEVDDHPEEYPRAVLERYKSEHEKRIRYLTGLGPELQTVVLQFKALIGGQIVDIPVHHVHEALAPRWPADREGRLIDLTSIPVDDDTSMATAAATIRQRVADLYKPGMEVERTRHISLFALGPIPLLVLLGRCLSNKVPLDLFQRHRDEESPWRWPELRSRARYGSRTIRKGSDPSRVALILSLSGKVLPSTLPSGIDGGFTIYELTLTNKKPMPDFLRSKADLNAFRRKYRAFLAGVMSAHPNLSEIHLFPAVPAPVAVACGHDLLPKVQPKLLVYDNDKSRGGFVMRLEVDRGA